MSLHNNKGDVITKPVTITSTITERALLVSVASKGSQERLLADNSMGELAQLAGTAGAEVVGSLIQHLPEPNRFYYVGKGKLEEIIALKGTLSYNVVIVDVELSPLQQRNLEDALQVKVIDRVALILDIFARRARTHEGRLQVELAQNQYLMPRLAGQWSHLERLGGGIGTRGPGESQLETDRRLINKKIQRLQRKIEEIRKHRSLYRQKRQKSGIPVVALVGYTNAGKSTLLNTLCQADVITEDQLFATLDPTTRRLTFPDHSFALLTDTVGFIRKLPPVIVSAFRATLEELAEARLLLHVVDLSSPGAAGQCQTVEDTLDELNLRDKPRITVLNKIDLIPGGGEHHDEASGLRYFYEMGYTDSENVVLVSAKKRWGFQRLLELIIYGIQQSPK